jgi:hypothetical protein
MKSLLLAVTVVQAISRFQSYDGRYAGSGEQGGGRLKNITD